jgi:phosphatidylglycerol:prolipoprotein diacylglycerol transferase
MPDGIMIGNFEIKFYGIIIMLGALLATWLSAKEAKRRGLNPEMIWDMLPWLLVAGVIGARLWHIFTPSASLVALGIDTKYYLTHPLDAINIRNGGLGIPGGVMGGALALWLYVRSKKSSFATWTDIIAPGLALAQGIGRWGNYFNQELYGGPTNLPWAIFIEPAYRLPQYIDQAYYHPMFLYEFLWDLMNMGVLLLLGRKFQHKLISGDIFLTYLIIYPVGRFLLEFMRLDPSNIGGVNANQTLMAVIAVLSAIALIVKHTVLKNKLTVAAVKADDVHTNTD